MLKNKFGSLYIKFDKYQSSEFIGENARLKAIKLQLIEDGASNLKAKRNRSYFGYKNDYFIFFDYRGITYRILLSQLYKLLDGTKEMFADKVLNWTEKQKYLLRTF